MVMIKTQPNAPLETIYEESGSFVASAVNMRRSLNHQTYTNGASSGLISARSIPSVNVHRQRAHDNQHKPPIEVRFRDGSKRFIHPSTAATMMMNRRKLLDSSDVSLSSKTMPNLQYQQFFNSNINKENFASKPPIVITIITANDLKQAGLTPTDSSSPETSSSSTPSLSKSISLVSQPLSVISQPLSVLSQPISTHSQSILAQSQSTSTVGASKTKKGTYKVSFAPLPPSTPVQSTTQFITNQSPLVLRPGSNLSQLSQEQQISLNHSQNSTPSQIFSTNSSHFSSVPSSKASTPSLNITLSSDRIESSSSFNSNKSVNYTNQPNTTTTTTTTTALIGGGTHSAFRPFNKPIHLEQNSFPDTRHASLAINGKSYKSPQSHRRQVVPYVQLYNQQYPAISSSSSSNITKIPVQLTSIQSENSSNYQPQFISTNHNINNPFTFQNILNISGRSGPTLSVEVSPQVKWYNVKSNNLSDIPHLSRRYAGIPLRITLPVVPPVHNQRLLTKHNIALEQRLLNAGLSPETVALYERILDVAENRQMSLLSPPNITDHYPYRSLLER